jgi:hypothetical protein
MKYTNYILKGTAVNLDDAGMLVIPSAIVAVPILVGFLCGALIMDSKRYLKLRYLLFKREQRNLNYIKCVIRSLDRVPNNQLIGLLRAA